jgi:SAM-dependent methyltransferase
MSAVRTKEPEIAPIVWHDLECGAYRADLPLLRVLASLAARRGRPCDVLDLGCGTGRVSLDLAAQGHRVTGLDINPRFAEELRQRAASQNVAAGAVVGDARELDLGRRFDLVLAALQFLQLLPDSRDRVAVLKRVRDHLRDRGMFAAALLDLSGEATDGDYVAPLPDMRETDGWVWSSQPIEVRLLDGGSALSLDRHRRAVSPRGEIVESEDSVRLQLVTCDELEEDLHEAGIKPAGRQQIPPTKDHVGSVVVLGEVEPGKAETGKAADG